MVDPSRLAAVPLFAGLTAEELAAISASANEVVVEQDRTVTAEGDFGHGMYVIEEGTAEVRVHGGVVNSLGPGDVFGEIAVIASGRRTASVVATSPLRLIAFFKRDVWALEKGNPHVAERLQALVADRRR